MEKILLPLDINNDLHLDELIQNPETYGNLVKDLIKTGMKYWISGYEGFPKSYKFEDEFFMVTLG